MKVSHLAIAASLAIAGVSSAATLDGQNIPSEGLTLRATQDAPTQFGNSSGTQNSNGGSELNQLFADVDGTTLKLGITGNLEGNFNKFFVFFDAVPGGESSLASDNVDGGFNEINNMAGLSFANGATMDHGLRFEIGSGFYGVRWFDLIDNVGGDVVTGGGPGDLPIANVGSGGVTVGWDNSNTLGVDGGSAAGAATATTGWEIEIDLATFFGAVQSELSIATIITSGDAGFLSNQSLPGLGAGANNLGGGADDTLPITTLTVIPEPAAALLCGVALAGFAARRARG